MKFYKQPPEVVVFRRSNFVWSSHVVPAAASVYSHGSTGALWGRGEQDFGEDTKRSPKIMS